AGMAASRLIASLGDAATDRAETLQYLRRVYEQCPTQDLFDVVFRTLRETEGQGPAWTFAREALERRPLLLGLDRLLEVQLAGQPAQPGDAVADPRQDWIS